jgi:hypothetical protein
MVLPFTHFINDEVPKIVGPQIHRLDPPPEAETAVPECEQIDEETEQNQGQPKSWHTFETP